MPGFNSTYTVVGGLTMHAKVSATPASSRQVPIVLVHGLGLSHAYMMPLAEVLAGELKVLVPDLPGFGQSMHPRHLPDLAQLAEWLHAWIEACGLGCVFLLGNSQGCQVIAHLAARHPGEVAGCILQGPTSPPDERSWLWQAIRWRQNNRYNPPELDPPTWHAYRQAGILRVLRTFRLGLRDALETIVPDIAAPTLVVRGQYDPICRADWARMLMERLPDGRLVVIPEVAHTLVFTAPEQLAAVTLNFVGIP